MYNYRVILYDGMFGINGHNGICDIVNETIVRANLIEEVNWRIILPKENAYRTYGSVKNLEGGDLDIDFGLWTRFIRVERVV